MSTPPRTTMNGKDVLFRPAKTVLNMESKFREKLLCDGPVFSLGDACAYKCSFCYVPSMMLKASYVPHERPHHEVVIRRENAVEILEKQLRGLKDSVRGEAKVIYSSHLVDVAANMELVRETIQACTAILNLTNWRIRLLSKSTLLPKIAEAFHSDKDRFVFGVSTGTLDDKLAAAFEEGCPKVSKRIESLHWLQDNGFHTFGMICPSLPLGSADEYHAWADEMHSALRTTQCEHVWAEVINLRGESFTRTVNALRGAGFDKEASAVERVSTNADAWEVYARQTFLAHEHRMRGFNQDHPDNLAGCHPRLRFLQYPTRQTLTWWQERKGLGAVLLGKLAHS